MEKEELLNDHIIPNCKEIFLEKPKLNTFYFFGGQIIEQCLFYFYDQNKELNIKKRRPSRISTLINILANKNEYKFAKGYLGFCQLARQNSNIQKHSIIKTIPDLSIYTYQIEMYLFIKWFVTIYLKSKPIEIAETWYKNNNPNNKMRITTPAIVSISSKPSIPKDKIIKQDTILSDELNYYKKQIEHKDKIIATLKMREAELMQKLINHK